MDRVRLATMATSTEIGRIEIGGPMGSVQIVHETRGEVLLLAISGSGDASNADAIMSLVATVADALSSKGMA